MNNYTYRLLITIWRKKSTVLACAILIILLIYGLQYTQSDYSKDDKEATPQAHALESLQTDKTNVKFLEAYNKKLSSLEKINLEVKMELNKKEQSALDIRNRKSLEESQILDKEIEQQLGIPYVNLNLKNPYIPKQRIVHFDLKGAPPMIGFYKKLFPLLKTMGATGILLEYEDMFPFSGILSTIKAKNAYTIEEVQEILQLATDSKLEVIPLVQTFGHVEFALKRPEWIKLREVTGSPQALCPSRNSSLDFITEIINQIMPLHKSAKYIHIGCDEVFQMGECDLCRLEMHETLFLRHIKNVAGIVHERYPKLKIIIWDDMLRHLNQQTMIDMKLGDLVEPMVWVYAEEIYRFVQPQVWEKYAAVFKTAWTASAYKGAFGETLYIPNAKRHLENNLRWLDIMTQHNIYFKKGFRGIALTGWQRYDHFAVLCELLPSSLPSLALSLLAVSNGYFNSSLKAPLLNALSCPQPQQQHQQSNRVTPFINLDADPHLWDKLGRCMFPGSPIFRLMYRLNNVEIETLEYLRVTKRNKGWLTDYNIKHNYTLPLRVDELVSELPRVYHSLIALTRSAYDAMNEIFDYYTIAEWIEQRIYPFVIEIEKLQNQTMMLKEVNVWPTRPLPPLKDLQRLGVPLP